MAIKYKTKRHKSRNMMEALTDTAFVSGDVTLDSKVKAAVTREFNKRCPAIDIVRGEDEDDIDTDSEEDEDRI